MKKFIILILSIFVLYSCSPCKKFVNYETKTINVSGLNAKIADTNISIGSAEIGNEYREASEEIQRLDSLQCSLCENIRSMSDGVEKTKAQVQYNETLIKLLQQSLGMPVVSQKSFTKSAEEIDPKTIERVKKELENNDFAFLRTTADGIYIICSKLNKPYKYVGKLCWNPSGYWVKDIVIFNSSFEEPSVDHPIWDYIRNLQIPDRKGVQAWETPLEWYRPFGDLS